MISMASFTTFSFLLIYWSILRFLLVCLCVLYQTIIDFVFKIIIKKMISANCKGIAMYIKPVCMQ